MLPLWWIKAWVYGKESGQAKGMQRMFPELLVRILIMEKVFAVWLQMQNYTEWIGLTHHYIVPLIRKNQPLEMEVICIAWKLQCYILLLKNNVR